MPTKYPMPAGFNDKARTQRRLADYQAHMTAVATLRQRVAERMATADSDELRAQLLRILSLAIEHVEACRAALRNGSPMPEWDALMKAQV